MNIPHSNQYFHAFEHPTFKRVLTLGHERLKEIMESKYVSLFKVVDSISDRYKEPVYLDTKPNVGLTGYESSPKLTRMLIRESLVSAFFKENHGAVIETTEELDHLMGNTDIDAIPCSLLKPAFSKSYFKFRKPIATPGYDDVINGVYVFHRVVPIDKNNPEDVTFVNDTGDEDINQLDFVEHYEMSLVMQCPPGTDQQTAVCINFTIGNNNQLGVLDYFKLVVDRSNFAVSRPGFEVSCTEAVTRVFKSMLYMGLKEARIQQVNELTEFSKKLLGLGQKKLAKLSNKANQKYDRILVGPERLQQHNSLGAGEESGKVTHWRRGHFRNQACGKGLKERQIMWIQPMIINAIADEVPEPKTYKMKA